MTETQSSTSPHSPATDAETISGSGVSSAAAGRSATGISSVGGVGAGGRTKFAADELAIVLSHYDLGVIEAIQEFPRGSRKAPKLVLKSETGTYLLKRRARGRDDVFKVAFCHGIQLHLAERQFPLPHLIGTRKDNNSILKWKNGIYELFEYIKGTPYDASLEATGDSGKILALFHKLLRDYKPKYDPPQGSYHAARSVQAAMQQIPQTLAKVDPAGFNDHRDRIDQLVKSLRNAYNDAMQRVVDGGIESWPAQIVHSDWHPGNMLFRGSRVVAVIDYDAARIQQRVIDVANGALQFSILGGGEDPSQWPEYLDESRFKRFIRGYDAVPDAMMSRAELRVLPWLMVEALIAEAVIPIAATGSFARMEGVGFMLMVHRKVRWLQKHAAHLVATLDG